MFRYMIHFNQFLCMCCEIQGQLHSFPYGFPVFHLQKMLFFFHGIAFLPFLRVEHKDKG